MLGHLLAARSQSWTDEEASNYANSLVQYSEEKDKGQRVGSLNEILSASRGVDIDGIATTKPLDWIIMTHFC